jgi:hypothetical protein
MAYFRLKHRLIKRGLYCLTKMWLILLLFMALTNNRMSHIKIIIIIDLYQLWIALF